mgnify:CR=1 FL=1
MPRKGPAPRRDLMPDPIHRSVVVTQLVNKVLLSGKRSTAERIVYAALDDIGRKTQGDPVAVLKRAIENVRPQLEVKSRRVGGATYQVPVEVRPRRATTLAIRWVVGYSRQRREKTMAERLAGELLDASNGIGAAVKRREDLQKMAKQNVLNELFRRELLSVEAQRTNLQVSEAETDAILKQDPFFSTNGKFDQANFQIGRAHV